jgi:hypothetical protein
MRVCLTGDVRLQPPQNVRDPFHTPQFFGGDEGEERVDGVATVEQKRGFDSPIAA